MRCSAPSSGGDADAAAHEVGPHGDGPDPAGAVHVVRAHGRDARRRRGVITSVSRSSARSELGAPPAPVRRRPRPSTSSRSAAVAATQPPGSAGMRGEVEVHVEVGARCACTSRRSSRQSSAVSRGLDAGPQVVRRVRADRHRRQPCGAQRRPRPRASSSRPTPATAVLGRDHEEAHEALARARRRAPATVAISADRRGRRSTVAGCSARRAVRASSSADRRVGAATGRTMRPPHRQVDAAPSGTPRQSPCGHWRHAGRYRPVKSPGAFGRYVRGEGRRDGAAVSTIEDLRDEITREERVVNLHADGTRHGRGDPAPAPADVPARAWSCSSGSCSPPSRTTSGPSSATDSWIDPDVARIALIGFGVCSVAVPVRQGAAPQAAQPARARRPGPRRRARRAGCCARRFVADATEAIHESLDLDEVVQRVVEQSCRLVGARRRVAAPDRRRGRPAPGRGAGRHRRLGAAGAGRAERATCSQVVGQTREPALLNSGTRLGAVRPARARRPPARPHHARRRRRRPLRRRRRRAARPLRGAGRRTRSPTPSATKPRCSSSTADLDARRRRGRLTERRVRSIQG